VIRVQLAFIKQLLGKEAEAIEILTTIIKHKPSDQAVMTVAANNIVSLRKDHDLFDALKRLKKCNHTRNGTKII